MTDWWLDEVQHAGSEHLDRQFVARFEAKSGWDPAADIALLETHGLGVGSTVVDLGCGTGSFAAAAAATGATVYAVDVSPAMLGVARAQTRGHANVEVVEAGLLTYAHPPGPKPEFVYTRNVLHQLPDFWKTVALRRIHRMLRPDGVLLLRDIVYDVEPDRIDVTIEAWLRRAGDDAAKGYTREELARHVRSEFSTLGWLLEQMLARTGFDILSKSVRQSVYAAYTCRATSAVTGAERP